MQIYIEGVFTLNDTLGSKIKRIRKQNNLTQRQLADGICTQALISMFESDETIPSSLVLYKISQKLNVTLNYFFEDPKPSEKVTTQENESFAIIRKMFASNDFKMAVNIVNEELKKGYTGNSYSFLLWHKGVCIAELDKDIESALNYLEQAIDNVETEDELIVSILNSKANIYYDHLTIHEATAIYEQALSIIETNDKINSLLTKKVLFGISRAYLKMELIEQALIACNRAIHLSLKEESLALLGSILFQQGRIYYHVGDYEQAAHSFTRAKVIFELEEKEEYLSICVINLNATLDKLKENVPL
jgi:transcriptional regulator with XRE-family HTH domain